MTTLREWVRRLLGTLRGNRLDRELEDELLTHVELAVEDLRRRGHSPEEALRAARLQMGGVAQAVEALRDQRGLPWLDDFTRDVRHGLLTLRRTPAFTAVVLLTLALAIGANTAIFSIVNGVILQPVAYAQSERLMYLTTQYPTLGITHFWVSPPEYLEFQELNQSFASVGAYTTGEANLNAGDRALRVRSALVDEHLLNVLGIQAAQGRLFAAGETDVNGPPPVPGAPSPLPPPIAILSHELWQSVFGGQPVVGQTPEIDGRRRQILGIMPPGTDIMDNRTQIWLPLGLNPGNRQNRGNHFLYLIGRLNDGVTVQSAETELDVLVQNWGERVGVKDHVFIPAGRDGSHILRMTPVQDEIVGGARRSIWVLQTAVGLVLLIACANLANLFLARAETRRRELAVRAALGASRGRLLRQFMTEGVLLSLGGGALGLVFAVVSVRALIRAYPVSLPRTSEVAIDPVVLLVTLGISTAIGVLFGFTPIMHIRMKGLMTALKEGGTRGATTAGRHHLRRSLVTAEVALAVMLVIGAGLLVRTAHNLTTVDPGFDRSRLTTFSLTLPPAAYPQAPARAQLYQRLLDQLRALPGVQAATAMSGLPPARPLDANYTDIGNYTPPPGRRFDTVDYYQNVMSGYFETMGIPIVQGRSFQRIDTTTSGMVAVVNERFVDTFWKGQNPIGQRLRPAGTDQMPWFTVIGVAKDVKQGGVDQQTGTEFYTFVEQQAAIPPPFAFAPDTMNVVLRSTLPPPALSASIERVVRDVDPAIPVVRFRDMAGVFAESIRRPKLLAQLVGAFAGLALLLAAIGTYGVLSYMVTERRREIGIRLALGADRVRLLALVMKQGLLLTAVGVVIGLAGALGVNRLMASLLFGVRPADGPTLAAVVAAVTLVAAGACALPAWRASRLDPNLVLRDE